MPGLTPATLALPYPAWNPGQLDYVGKIVAALTDPATPVVVFEAPTGVGKSAIAAAVSRLIGGKRRIFLTGTLALQDQYATQLDLLTARGRSNFVCEEEPTRTADRGICTRGRPCDRKDAALQMASGDTPLLTPCSYYTQRYQAEKGDEAVLNYAYWLAMANYARAFTPVDLLICDEAHDLDDELRKFVTVTITRSQLRQVNTSPPGKDTSLLAWLVWAENIAPLCLNHFKAVSDDERDAKEKVRRAITMLRQADEDGWVLETNHWGWTFRPVWVQPFTQPMLLAHAKKVLMMSATILDKELFCFQLGLDPDKTAFIQAPSPFPVANRPLVYRSVGKVKGGHSREGWDAVVREVDAILDQHPNERGLIHTVSYNLATYIEQHSKAQYRHGISRLMLPRNSAQKPAVVAAFKADPTAVLISPSMTTGIDLPYDLLRFQIVAKLAFPDRGDEQTRKRMKLDPTTGEESPIAKRWYTWATATSLVQAYGRGIRAVDDACTTYLLDGNFGWFRQAARDMLPAWFTDAIKREKATGTTETSGADAIAKIRAEILGKR